MKHYLTKRKIAFSIILVIAVAFFMRSVINKESGIPKQYLIETENHIDYQQHFECAGFASAYVLRSLGIEADGKKIYSEIEHKEPDGGVSPESLVDYLNAKGYEAAICDGSMSDIKREVAKGVPVIAFVKVSPDIAYLHYLPIVGYDEENIYAADSLTYTVNAKKTFYNRKMSNEDFQNMWNVTFGGEKIYNIYITIGVKV